MGSVTSWLRLEPRPRSADMRPSLEARVHDPLWLLGRQWQLGEFQGEDAGSPVISRLRGQAVRLSAYRGATDAGVAASPYDPDLPLETLVEAEPVSDTANRRLAAESGLQFLGALQAAGAGLLRDAFIAAFPLRVPETEDLEDAAGRRYLRVMAVAGRVPDGVALYDALEPALAAGRLPETPAVSDEQRGPVMTAARAWLTWHEQVRPAEPPRESCWRAERMEYAFSVGARAIDREGIVLTAPEYQGGRLDWDAFVIDDPEGFRWPEPEATEQPIEITHTSIPSPATYAGMPAPRWWQFEDARVDFGGIESAPTDLARMLVTAFASDYSNDWYITPISIPIGTLTTITSLVVTDTFGGRWLVQPANDPRWDLFSLSRAASAEQPPSRTPLLLAPTLGAALEGDPVEEVVLIRDEIANLAWAIERRVQGLTGAGFDRAESIHAARRLSGESEPPARDFAAPLVYRLATSVPEHWIPLLPEASPTGGMRLRRGAMERPRNDTMVAIEPRGRLLAPDEPLVLYEEEVPRSGARVTRAAQYARWTGGSTHFWIAKQKRPGRGEGSSGLRFDAVDPA